MYERMLIADNWLISLTVSLLEHVYTDEDISQDYEDYELDADLQTMQEDVSSDSQYENVVRKEKWNV